MTARRILGVSAIALVIGMSVSVAVWQARWQKSGNDSPKADTEEVQKGGKKLPLSERPLESTDPAVPALDLFQPEPKASTPASWNPTQCHKVDSDDKKLAAEPEPVDTTKVDEEKGIVVKRNDVMLNGNTEIFVTIAIPDHEKNCSDYTIMHGTAGFVYLGAVQEGQAVSYSYTRSEDRHVILKTFGIEQWNIRPAGKRSLPYN